MKRFLLAIFAALFCAQAYADDYVATTEKPAVLIVEYRPQDISPVKSSYPVLNILITEMEYVRVQNIALEKIEVFDSKSHLVATVEHCPYPNESFTDGDGLSHIFTVQIEKEKLWELMRTELTVKIRVIPFHPGQDVSGARVRFAPAKVL